MAGIAVMYRDPNPPTERMLAQLRALAPRKLAFPEYVLAKIDLMSGPEVRRMIDHLSGMPDVG